jgi:hypothetical protein
MSQSEFKSPSILGLKAHLAQLAPKASVDVDA